MKEDSDQKERCNKKAEGKFGFFEDCQSDTTSKKAKKRSLYKQNIFCSSKLITVRCALCERSAICYNRLQRPGLFISRDGKYFRAINFIQGGSML